jgi:hypothetical protein
MCFNAASACSYLPRTIKMTDLALAGRTEAEADEIIAAAVDQEELPAMELGAMCYMMSRQGYLSDRIGHGIPHLMFNVPQGTTWGGGAPGSPVLLGPQQFPGPPEPVSIFVIMAPETVTSASPSTACTSASNGDVCSLNPCSWSKAKIVTFPFSRLRMTRLTTDPSW